MEVTPGIKRNAVICILKSADRFLLLKRAKEPNKNLFTPVGGKLDPFENPDKTAVRETLEETGILVTSYRYRGSLIETSPTQYNWHSLIYTVEIPFQPAPPCNEGTLEWIDIDQIPDIPTPKTDWYIYQYVISEKPFFFNAEFDDQLLLTEMREAIENKVLVGNGK